MYIPGIFKNDKLDEVKDFISNNSFAILINQSDSRLQATHIPLDIDINEVGQDVLVGHISRANPQWKGFGNNVQVLAVFTGPDSYISSSWYDHENVPTWNYVAVHIYGRIKIIEGEKLYKALKKQVDKYEQESEHPVSLEKMSEEFLRKEIKGIVGFEIEIEEIQAAYKLSQNRDKKNHGNIIYELEKKGDPKSLKIAEEMKKNKNKNE